MEFFLMAILINIVAVAAVFVCVWFIAGKNKTAFAEKLTTLDKKIDGIDQEMSVTINTSNDFNENLLTELRNLQKDNDEVVSKLKIIKEDGETYFHETLGSVQKVDEVSNKIKDQHEEYHDGMLEKLNHAGELIVGYETFFENSLAELEDLSRFVDVLSKRPAVSNDPDFTSFVRAVQVMVQILSRYSTVATDLKRESQVTKTD